MNRIRILSLLTVLLVCTPLWGQIQGGYIIDTLAALPALHDDMEDNLSLRTTLDNMFSELEKNRVPTGLLKDYAVELVDISIFNGTLNDTTLLNAKTFEYILRSIRSSAVGQKPFQTVSSIMADMKSHQTRTVIPFGLAAFRYNCIVANAISSQLISYNESTGKVYDQYQVVPSISPGILDPIIEPEPGHPGEPFNPEPILDPEPFLPEQPEPILNELEWVNPYAEAYVYAASPSVDIITTPYVTFSFSADWIFSNLNIVSLEFDSGLGQGYQTISLSGEDYSVYYGGQGGVFETKTRMTLADGTVLQSHNAVCVYPLDALVVPMVEPDTTKSFVSNITIEGHTPRAAASIKYSTTNFSGQILKPLIIAEGFDPLSILNNEPDSSYYHNRGANTLNQILSSTPLNNEYDIIYVDWEDSCAPIEANADILIQVVQWVNSIKIGSEPNVVLGYSMGGLIARYALRKMEIDGILHQTNTYVSYDTPHLGAHVPLGYMYLARDLYNGVFIQPLPALVQLSGLVGLLIYRLINHEFDTSYNEVLSLSEAPSVRQMLYYYVNSSNAIDNSRRITWQQTLSGIGFPKGQGNVPMNLLAVSNGGINTSPLPLVNLSLDGSFFADYWVTSLYDILLSLASGSLGIIEGTLWGSLMLLFPHQTTYALEADVTPFVSDNQEVYYAKMTIHKRFFWLFDIDEVAYETHRYGQSNGELFYETLPSSYYVVHSDSTHTTPHYYGNTLDTLGLSYNCQIYSHIPFVPVASSLCSNSYNMDFSSNTLSALSHTPFNSYFIGNNSTEHISPLYGAYDWISDASKFRIYGGNDNTLATGDSLRVSPLRFLNGTWYSENQSVATVNPYGRITVSRRGAVTIGYKGIDSSGHPYNFKRNFFAGGRPQFRLSYERLPLSLDDGSNPYIIWASYIGDSGLGLTPSRIVWGETESLDIPLEGEPQITTTWTESSSFTYSTSIPWNSHKYIIFYAEYDGFSSNICLLYCENPDYNISGLIGDGGELLPLGQPEGDGIEVKSAGDVDDSLTYIINGQSFEYEGRPDDYTVLSCFLENVNFVNQIKEMAPWGDKEFVIIPFRVIDNTTSEVFDSCVKLLYQNKDNNE